MARELKVLDALDAAKTQRYHFTAVVIAGMGFFTDAYDLFSISLVTKLLGRIYYFNPSSKTPGSLPPNVSAAVNGVAFCVASRLASRSAYKDDPAGSTVPQADYAWRVVLMFGAIPALLSYYWRTKMPETARYTALVAKNAEQAASDMTQVLNVEIVEEPEQAEELARREQFGLFSRQFAMRHGLHLLGTTVCWFTLDIAFYSQNLFQKDIYTAVNWLPKAETMNALEEMFKISRAQTLVALCGTIPGYWFTVFFIDIIGRFAIQLGGFFFMTAFMLGLAVPYHHWTTPGHHIGFVVMYAFTFFFANFGPNSTTFISTDPKKTDAGYPPGIGVRNSLFMLAGCNVVGFFFTFLVPESKGKSLEELSGENEDEKASETSAAADYRSIPPA
ncbi:unnamed protein product [Urochloa decumbens]|uniref:H(+)/Pi cotransporter n=1 Tax=Urochloa decumbens TaxID=240449 RepID=A0ABC9CD26_9POAL